MARKVQKSLSDLEKLHLSGQGINLSLPTSGGQNKVWTNSTRYPKYVHVSYLITFLFVSGIKEPAFCGQVYRDCPAHIPGVLGIWV